MYRRIVRIIQNIPRSAKITLLAAVLLARQYSSSTENYSKRTMSNRIPSAFIPHGGGPLPILGDKDHKSMVKWLSSFADTYLTGPTKPKACLVISAHWEARLTTIQSGSEPSLYYDYYNFPKEAYSLNYPLKPDLNLVKRIVELLDKNGIKHELDSNRGYDHGVFIPLKIIYPDADIPTIQLSLVAGLDPETHIKIGEALEPLRDEGVFILGSGMSFHNMRNFMSTKGDEDSGPFHDWLRNVITPESKSYQEKVEQLKGWKNAPKAKENHPREEHLIPLFSILGTSKTSEGKGKEVFFDKVAGVRCAGYVFKH